MTTTAVDVVLMGADDMADGDVAHFFCCPTLPRVHWQCLTRASVPHLSYKTFRLGKVGLRSWFGSHAGSAWRRRAPSAQRQWIVRLGVCGGRRRLPSKGTAARCTGSAWCRVGLRWQRPSDDHAFVRVARVLGAPCEFRVALDEGLHATGWQELVELGVHTLVVRPSARPLVRNPRRVERAAVRLETQTDELNQARVRLWRASFRAGTPQPRRDMRWPLYSML